MLTHIRLRRLVEHDLVERIAVMQGVALEKGTAHLAIPDFVDIFLAFAAVARVKTERYLSAIADRHG